MRHIDERFAHIRRCLHRPDFTSLQELEEHIDHLETEVAELLALAEAEADQPATAHVTSSQKGQPMGSYIVGADVDLFAIVRNDKGVNIANDGIWGTDQGTITPGPNGVDQNSAVVMTAVLSGVTTPATANITFTTTNGIQSPVDAIEFTEDPNANVPVSAEVVDFPAAPTA